MYKSTISKEEIAELPTIAFNGDIVVVDSYSQQEEVADYLKGYDIIGFDTESRAVFKKGVKNSISLLQLHAGNKTFLIRLYKTQLNRGIIQILRSASIKKIGVAVRDDIKELQAVAKFTPKNFIDLQTIVHEWGIQDKSLLKITAIVMGGRISKAQRLSNWNASRLTQAQEIYAATDAWTCSEIYKNLINSPKVEIIEKTE